MDELFKGVFAAGGGVGGVVVGADELYDVYVIEEDGGVAGRVNLKRCGHEVGKGEGQFHASQGAFTPALIYVAVCKSALPFSGAGERGKGCFGGGRRW